MPIEVISFGRHEQLLVGKVQFRYVHGDHVALFDLQACRSRFYRIVIDRYAPDRKIVVDVILYPSKMVTDVAAEPGLLELSPLDLLWRTRDTLLEKPFVHDDIGICVRLATYEKLALETPLILHSPCAIGDAESRR